MFRSWRVKENLNKISKEQNIHINDNICYLNGEKCIIIDSHTNVYYQGLVPKILKNLNFDYNMIILANLDKDKLPDIHKISHSFPKDIQPYIKIYNYNLNTDVHKLLEELYNTLIKQDQFYGPLKKKFNCYLRYNKYSPDKVHQLGEFTPNASAMCPGNNLSMDSTSFLLCLMALT
jgi:hypothetical protein